MRRNEREKEKLWRENVSSSSINVSSDGAITNLNACGNMLSVIFIQSEQPAFGWRRHEGGGEENQTNESPDHPFGSTRNYHRHDKSFIDMLQLILVTAAICLTNSWWYVSVTEVNCLRHLWWIIWWTVNTYFLFLSLEIPLFFLPVFPFCKNSQRARNENTFRSFLQQDIKFSTKFL